MPQHLAKSIPYSSTKIPAEQTQFQIQGMLSEFVIIDPTSKRKKAWIGGIQWTTLQGQMPVLKFSMEYDTPDGLHKVIGVQMQPPMLLTKHGQGSNARWSANRDASMRLLYWYLKNKLEAVLFGLKDATEEFMADVLVRLPGSNAPVRMAQAVLPGVDDNKVLALPFGKEGS